MNKLDELKAILDGMDESMLAKAEKALMAVKDGCSEDEEAKKKAEEEAAKKKAAEDEAAKKAAEDAAAKEAAEKKAAEDAAIAAAEHEKKIAAVKDEAIKSYKEAVALHDQLVPHIGEFVMDGMDTAQAVAEYGCKKLELNVNAGSEIATLTGFLAGRKGKAGKVVTTDEAAKPAHSFDFKAAYLAK